MKNLHSTKFFPFLIGILLLSIGLPLSFQHIQQNSFIQEVQAKPIEPGESKIKKKPKYKRSFKRYNASKREKYNGLWIFLGVVLSILGLYFAIGGLTLTITYLNNNSYSNLSGNAFGQFLFIIVLVSIIGLASLGLMLLLVGIRILVKRIPRGTRRNETLEENPTIVEEILSPQEKVMLKINNISQQLIKIDQLIVQHGSTEDLVQQKIKLRKKLKKEAAKIEKMLPQFELEQQEAAKAFENADSKNQEKLQVELAEKTKRLEQAKQIAVVKDDHKALRALIKSFE